MTLFAGDEYEDDEVTSGPLDDHWHDDLDGGGPGLDWDDGPEPPPGRRVVAIKTTGDRL